MMDWHRIMVTFNGKFWDHRKVSNDSQLAIDAAFEEIKPLIEEERVTVVNVVGPATINHVGDLELNNTQQDPKPATVTVDAADDGPFKLPELNREWARLQKEGLSPIVFRNGEKYRMEPVVYVRGGRDHSAVITGRMAHQKFEDDFARLLKLADSFGQPYSMHLPAIEDGRVPTLSFEYRKPFVSDIPLPKGAGIVEKAPRTATQIVDDQMEGMRKQRALAVTEIKDDLRRSLSSVLNVGPNHGVKALNNFLDKLDELIKFRVDLGRME